MPNLSFFPALLGLILTISLPRVASADATPTPAQDSLAFPESWVGVWTGELTISGPQGPVQQLPMELHILPLDTVDRFSWTIIYGEDKEAGARKYQLQVIDRAKGLYAVDELNSIVLESYYRPNKLFSRYLVGEIMILITNEVRGDTMTFEVIAGGSEPVSITGDTTLVVDGESIPEVRTYPIGATQKATLTRKK
ncbi:MAG: hypothetical protein AAFW73_02950 [Bacteroidota bacterium]